MASISRKRRASAEERRAAVEASMLAALEQLLESGRSFTELTVDELARTGGISRSYFYMHFRDKGALVKALMAQVAGELAEAPGIWFRQPEQASRDDIKQAMVRIIAVYEKHQAILRAVAETALYDPEIKALYLQMMEGLVAESRKAVSRLKKAGRAAQGSGTDVAEVLTWITERLCGLYIGHSLLEGSRRLSKARLAESLTHIVWSASIAPGKDQPIN